MSAAAAEFAKLKALYNAAVLLTEGGNPVALLPAFGFKAAGADVRMNLVLVPFQHSGYVTRLFFERRIEGCGQNWTQHRVVDRQWWAPSWNHVQPSLSWPAMLCAHLRAVA